jgi:hypothetical protein
MLSHIILSLSTKERNLKFLRDIFLLLQMKFTFVFVLVHTLSVRQSVLCYIPY